jgi:hypothetical protein
VLVTFTPIQEHLMTQSRSLSRVVLGALVALAAACGASNTTSPNAKTVSLSFSSKNLASGAAANRVSFLTLGSGNDTLVITKAQVVLSKIELATADTATCASDSNGGSCEEIKADPALVDIPVDQSMVTPLVSAIPAGTYTKFEAKVNAVQASDPAGGTFLTSHPDFAGVSVRVEGTFNGTPFVYTGSAGAELELEFTPPLVVDSTGMNITVNVDISRWFVSGGGALVDPTTANAGGPNASMVDNNIHHSFEAFEDDNKDGHNDSQP